MPERLPRKLRRCLTYISGLRSTSKNTMTSALFGSQRNDREIGYCARAWVDLERAYATMDAARVAVLSRLASLRPPLGDSRPKKEPARAGSNRGDADRGGPAASPSNSNAAPAGVEVGPFPTRAYCFSRFAEDREYGGRIDDRLPPCSQPRKGHVVTPYETDVACVGCCARVAPLLEC